MSRNQPYTKIVYGVIVDEDSCPPPWDENDDGNIETYWAEHFAGPNNTPCPVETRCFAGDGSGLIISHVDSVSYDASDTGTCYKEFDPTTLTIRPHWDCLLKNFCILAHLKIEAGPGWFLVLEY